MDEKDRKLIIDIANRQEELNKNLELHIKFCLERFNSLQVQAGQKYTFNTIMKDPLLVDNLASEIKPILEKYQVKNLLINLV